MSWFPFDLATKLNGQRVQQSVRNASTVTNRSSLTVRGGTPYVDGDRDNTAYFAGSGTIGSGTLTLDDDHDLPAGWSAVGDGVGLPYGRDGIFALLVKGEIEVVGASVPGYEPHAALGGLLLADVVVTDAVGAEEFNRIHVPITSATVFVQTGDDLGELFFQGRTSKFIQVVLVPANNFGVSVEIHFDTITDPGEFSGEVGVVVSATHIPITRFS